MHRCRLHVPAREHLLQNPAVGRVVIDHEHVQPFERARSLEHRRARCRRQLEHGGEMKGAAAVDFAFDPQLASHQLDELAGDRQAEPGPAVPAGRRTVCLGKRLEDLLHFFGSDADAGVTNAEGERRAKRGGRLQPDGQDHFAARSELDGVAENVQQHLTEPAAIADERLGHIGCDVAGQFDPFFARAQRQHFGRIPDGFAELEWGVLEIHSPRLDLREIEDVVDQLEQRIGRRLDGGQVIELLDGELRLQRQVGHAEDGIERCPNLVAHVGQKCALRLSRLLRAPLGDLELFDQLAQLGM